MLCKYTVLACSPVSLLPRPSERSCTSEMCHQRAERREQSRCGETLLLQVSQLLQPAASQTAESILLLSEPAVVRNRVLAAAPACQRWLRPRSERLNGRGAISFVRGNTERKSVTADGIPFSWRLHIVRQNSGWSSYQVNMSPGTSSGDAWAARKTKARNLGGWARDTRFWC